MIMSLDTQLFFLALRKLINFTRNVGRSGKTTEKVENKNINFQILFFRLFHFFNFHSHFTLNF